DFHVTGVQTCALPIFDLTHYSRGQMFSATAAAHALGGAAAIIMTAIVLLFLVARPEWSLFGWVGAETFALVVGSALCLRLLYVQPPVLAAGQEETGHGGAAGAEAPLL